jgi:HEAT repeat protein
MESVMSVLQGRFSPLRAISQKIKKHISVQRVGAAETPRLPAETVSAVLDRATRSVMPSVRASVARAVPVAAAVPVRPSVQELVGALRDPSAEAARDAATALGDAGDRAAVDALVAVLANVDGYFHLVVRSAAAASLGVLRDPRGTSALVAALQDASAEISAEAARALGRSGDATALPALRELLANINNYYHPLSLSAAAQAIAMLDGNRGSVT